jgi:hypothetical protein
LKLIQQLRDQQRHQQQQQPGHSNASSTSGLHAVIIMSTSFSSRNLL